MLESRELTKKYGTLTAVDHVTLSMEPGHIYGMLGPNGSGKTTWMKMAAGLVKPTKGTVYFNGEPAGLKSRAHIAYMSTEPYFYSWMTAKDLGKYYQDFFRDFSMDSYLSYLKTMDLEEKLKLSSLSSGMTAKLKVAVTLARDAQVYMLDEPFNGIDLLARDLIRTFILKAADPSKILLLSSHLVEEMETIVDSAVFIRKGQLVEVRSLKDLMEKDSVTMTDRYRAIYGHVEVNS